MSSWLQSPCSILAASTGVTGCMTLVAILLPLLLLTLTMRRRSTPQRAHKPFPFLELPQELRDMVYEYFLDDPVYPAPAPTLYQTTSSVVSWVKPGRWTLAATSTSPTSIRGSKWIFLANKQIYAEYMDMLCKRRTFCFNVSPQTYKPVAMPPTPTPAPASTTPPSSPSMRHESPPVACGLRSTPVPPARRPSSCAVLS